MSLMFDCRLGEIRLEDDSRRGAEHPSFPSFSCSLASLVLWVQPRLETSLPTVSEVLLWATEEATVLGWEEDTERAWVMEEATGLEEIVMREIKVEGGGMETEIGTLEITTIVIIQTTR